MPPQALLAAVALALLCGGDAQVPDRSCAMRGSCVRNRVCGCAPGSDGCEAGSDVCPFPGNGAPCELPADPLLSAPQPAATLAPSIEHVCPGVLRAEDLVCCNDEQLTALQQQLDMAEGLLGNCPACWTNFRRFWCVFTCSPQQASFVTVTKSRTCDSSLFPGPNSGPNGAPLPEAAGCAGTVSSAEGNATVQEVLLRVDEEYAAALFRSCMDVTVSATGQKAVDMAFGGASSAADFLEFQGVTAYASGQNPLKISVQLVNTSFAAQAGPVDGATKREVGEMTAGVMREQTVACHVDDAELGCLCNDCSTACPEAPGALNSSVWYRVSLEPLLMLDVNVLLAAAAFALVLLFAQALLEALEETQSGLPGFSFLAWNFQAPVLENACAGVACPAEPATSVLGVGETRASRDLGLMARLIEIVGRCCASQPRRVMTVWGGIVVMCVLCLVAMPMQVLRDPVKLWAQAGSRSAGDRRAFDASFGPFWRTEMLILRPRARSSSSIGAGVDHGRATREGGAGGVAAPQVLASVLQLQVEIESLRVSCDEVKAGVAAGGGVTTRGAQDKGEEIACASDVSWGLEELCFQPTPGGGCMVQSALEFWQMNLTRLLSTSSACEPMSPSADYQPTNATECLGALGARINRCAKYGASMVDCWSRAGVPLVQPKILFGSAAGTIDEAKVGMDGANMSANWPASSEALVVTYLLNNDPWSAPRAAAWEKKVLGLLQQGRGRAGDVRSGANRGNHQGWEVSQWMHELEVSFSVERAIEDEIARGGEADVGTVMLSYVVMLCYVTFSVGRGGAKEARREGTRARSLVQRGILAATALGMVAVSILVAAALCSVLGVPATMILSEVIPFLVLAIGVDNVFLLTWAFDHAAEAGTQGQAPASVVGRANEAPEGICREEVERAGNALATVGPSIVCAATAECGAFLLGASTGMPAVISFSRFAAAAVSVDVLVQLTLYPAVLSLTYSWQLPSHAQARVGDDATPEGGQGGAEGSGMSAGRGWLLHWIERCRQRPSGSGNRGGDLHEQLLEEGDGSGSMQDGPDGAVRGLEWEARVMSKDGRAWVLVAAIVLVVWSLIESSRVEVGLDQIDPLPADSFLIRYFHDLATYVQVGPPVFFTVTGAGGDRHARSATGAVDRRARRPVCNLSEPEDVRKICTRRGCRRDSLGNTISNAARFSNYTYLATGASNIADDLVSWLLDARGDPAHACCRHVLLPDGQRGPLCPAHWNPKIHPGTQAPPAACLCNKSLSVKSPACASAPQVPCEVAAGCLAPGLPDRAFERYNATSGAGTCWGVALAAFCPRGGEHPFCAKQCYASSDFAPCVAPAAAFPAAADLRGLFADFVRAECPVDPSDASCAVCGMHYRADLANLSLAALHLRGAPVPPEEPRADPAAVSAMRFMAYHAPLRSQHDYVAALQYAYKLADDLSQRLNLSVAPYSVFYVFFEQYVGIEAAAMQVSVLALGVVALVVCGLLRSVSSALLVLVTAVAVELALVGAMGLGGVKLNALSTVNLVAAIGISVEFSVHVVHGFAHAQGSREQRALQAMRGVGSAVVSGIAVTKLLGVSVLGLASSRIFIVYYFRMYLTLVAAGCFYGLLVLPVLLSLFGPENLAPSSAHGHETAAPGNDDDIVGAPALAPAANPPGAGGYTSPLKLRNRKQLGPHAGNAGAHIPGLAAGAGPAEAGGHSDCAQTLATAEEDDGAKLSSAAAVTAAGAEGAEGAAAGSDAAAKPEAVEPPPTTDDGNMS